MKKIGFLIFFFFLIGWYYLSRKEHTERRSKESISKEIYTKDQQYEEKKVDKKSKIIIKKIDTSITKVQKKDSMYVKSDKKVAEKNVEKINPGKMEVEDGIDKKIIIRQSFIYPDKNEEFISPVYKVNIVNPGFVSFSAYTLDMNDKIQIYYKYYDGNKWTTWIELSKDTHFVNKKRNVFGLAIIQSDIKKIQFKSNTAPQSEVVFRFFIPKQ